MVNGKIPPLSLQMNDPATSLNQVEGFDIADRKTITHLLKSGIGANTLRATRSDLAYIEAWVMACDGSPLPWPPP
jgi:hypothetical protein